MYHEIRRKDRVLDEKGAIELLETAEYGFLSMVGTDGFGYGIPISFVKEGKSVYFHCAPEGYKLEKHILVRISSLRLMNVRLHSVRYIWTFPKKNAGTLYACWQRNIAPVLKRQERSISTSPFTGRISCGWTSSIFPVNARG